MYTHVHIPLPWRPQNELDRPSATHPDFAGEPDVTVRAPPQHGLYSPQQDGPNHLGLC